jgi:hypothetical protein
MGHLAFAFFAPARCHIMANGTSVICQIRVRSDYSGLLRVIALTVRGLLCGVLFQAPRRSTVPRHMDPPTKARRRTSRHVPGVRGSTLVRTALELTHARNQSLLFLCGQL